MFEPDFKRNPPLILIIEDEKTLRLLYRSILIREGYTVEQVANGEEGLQFCTEKQPDLILLDAMMPGIDGFTCCEQLQKKLGENCPPILMITTLNNQKSVELAFQKGATEYITKPINWAVLRMRIYRLLKTRWAFQELQKRYEEAQELSKKLAIANQKLERLASIDSLTQIANRRIFDQRLKEEWKRARRESFPLSLILCDIDYFKKYNDHYGHQKGDYCLQQVAEILKDSCQRAGDLVARYGGEEFGIILWGINVEEATLVAKKIRKKLALLALPHLNNPDSNLVTLSMGIATLIPNQNYQETDLLTQADRALYQAKAAGRDRAVVFQSFP